VGAGQAKTKTRKTHVVDLGLKVSGRGFDSRRLHQFENTQDQDSSHSEPPQHCTKSKDFQGCGGGHEDPLRTLPEHLQNAALQKKCALFVHRSTDEIPAEVDFIIGAWPDLAEDFKEEMVEMIMRILDKEK